MRQAKMSAIAVAFLASLGAAPEADWRAALAKQARIVKSIGPEGKNGAEAAAAARELSRIVPPAAMVDLLSEFRDANPIAANLLRSVVESVADRTRRDEGALPAKDLERYALSTEGDPRSRRLAYELLAAVDPTAKDRLIPGLLADPSPELRREAVAYHVAEAERRKADGKEAEAKEAFQKALTGATDADQVRAIVDALKGFGIEVNVQKHFGFITEWRVAGPFDNRGMKGFDAVYPPENGVDFAAAYQGQLGEVSWKPIATTDPYGVIDIAKQIENYKGSAMYLAAEFESAEARPVEVRIGTPNSWKLWVNGEYLFSRQEYHRGEELDQYRVPAKLKQGRNLILFKILQNEQSDSWAQSYSFRLRVSDAAGRAVLPAPVAASTAP